jgi:hypothetical protein
MRKIQLKTTKFRAFINVFKTFVKGRPKYPFHNGILIKVPVSECFVRVGYPVITLEGDTGLITSFHSNLYQPKASIWLDVKLLNKSFKHVHHDNIFVLFMYLPYTGKYYPVSHSCYTHITLKHINKVFPFRITKRNNAMLSDTFKLENEYVAKLAKSRYSNSFIQRIESLNYKIKKQ